MDPNLTLTSDLGHVTHLDDVGIAASIVKEL